MFAKPTFLLKEHLSDGSYATIAGFKIEEKQSAPNSLRVVAKGIFTQSSAARSMDLAAIYGTEADYELSFETGDRYRAKFAIESLEYAGTCNGEQQYRLTMKSVGPVKILECL